jgi:zinc D-Ala-D-Ala carboxypeptidase
MNQLSTHFSLEELIATQHRGIDNTPPADVVTRLARTAQGLEAVRTRLGVPVIISSGYRCPALNHAVGGQPSSQHLVGEAADFIAPQFGPPATVVSALVDCRDVDFDQLIEEHGAGVSWVHVSFVSDRAPRRQVLMIDASGTRPWGDAA